MKKEKKGSKESQQARQQAASKANKAASKASKAASKASKAASKAKGGVHSTFQIRLLQSGDADSRGSSAPYEHLRGKQ